MDGELSAATGFQKGNYTYTELDKLFKEGLGSDTKEILYLNKRLRSALDIYKHGGNVTAEFRDQVFRLMFDNKRLIINDIEGSPLSALDGLFESDPLKDVESGALFRYLIKRPYYKKYQKRLSTKVFKNRYKNVLEIVVRNFIRCLLIDKLNLDSSAFNSYQEIADFVNSYDTNLRFTPNIIAQLKRRPIKPKKLYKDEVVDMFIDYVKIKFPDFDSVKFYNEYDDSKETKVSKDSKELMVLKDNEDSRELDDGSRFKSE